MFKAQFGNAKYSDIAFAITTRIDATGCFGIIEYDDMKDFKGYGRSRSQTDGYVLTRHFNDYVNCLHTQVGLCRENMEVYVAEIEDMNINKIGQLSSSQNSRIVDVEGISPAMTNGEKDGMPKIIERNTPMKGNYQEPRICTMVGRDPENPSSRQRSDRYEQMIELSDDVSNTLTSVQKDNLVAEPQVLTPKRTEFGKSVRKQYEAGELDMSRHAMTELEPRKDGISNTLTSVQKDNMVAEPIAEEPLRIRQATKQGYIEVEQGGFFDATYPYSTTRRGRVQEGGTIAPTLMASGEAPCRYEGVVKPLNADDEGLFRTIKSQYYKNSKANFEREGSMAATGAIQASSYRIRKLTPRECFRLMGVCEADIDKIQASGVSNSQQYKMAGNSIVVDVLYHIFNKMFCQTQNESGQLSLF